MTSPAPRIAIAVVVTALVAGAIYLYAVRGPALLLDLSAMAAGVMCF